MDKQTAKFIAKVSENLPNLDPDVMQSWIENPKALQKALKEALCPPEKTWTEDDGIIYFSAISDGTTGEEWEARLKAKGRWVSDDVGRFLCSSDFKPTTGVKYEIAVMKNAGQTIGGIRKAAIKLGFSKLNAEAACLIGQNFSEYDIGSMGISSIVILDCFRDSENKLSHMFTYFCGGVPWLHKWIDSSEDVSPIYGFAFAVSKSN